MHVDPAVESACDDRVSPVAPGPHVGNGKFDMPVVWTKVYGEGRVFYSSMGHHADIVEMEPHLTIIRRGLAVGGKMKLNTGLRVKETKGQRVETQKERRSRCLAVPIVPHFPCAFFP